MATVGKMSNSEDFSDLGRRIQLQEGYEEERSNLLRDLVSRYKNLHQKCNQLSRDLDNEMESRRSWQERFDTKTAECERMVHQNHAKPIFLILIDGDGGGYTFQESLLKDGEVGGGQAAQLLRDSIKNRVASMIPAASQWSIMVHIYANFAGLAKTLMAYGIIDCTTKFEAFVSGFNKFNPLFNFVDAGNGKECADTKIREMLNLFIDSPQYKQFLCGVTHDNGYARILTQYSDRMNKIILLEAGPSANEFRHLKFDRWSFPSVFRSHHFPRRVVKYASQTPNPQAPKATSSTGSDTTLLEPTRAITTQYTHRAVSNEIWLNANGARIDAPPPGFPYKVKTAFEKRFKTNGVSLCNAHYLSTCVDAQCTFSHSEQLSHHEIAALRYKMRIFVCNAGSSCRSFNCFYGHACPFDADCYFKSGCKFSTSHGMDKVVKEKLKPPTAQALEHAASNSDGGTPIEQQTTTP